MHWITLLHGSWNPLRRVIKECQVLRKKWYLGYWHHISWNAQWQKTMEGSYLRRSHQGNYVVRYREVFAKSANQEIKIISSKISVSQSWVQNEFKRALSICIVILNQSIRRNRRKRDRGNENCDISATFRNKIKENWCQRKTKNVEEIFHESWRTRRETFWKYSFWRK